ncbi:ribosome biosynthesis protein [Cichlidogyrus casuarinus]|uniref:Protein MAK16 homolog n=1 Tax=Cichlidogyrus casuarinus TaxID=1844966 RepID=A0ABD2QRB0_9PLAT
MNNDHLIWQIINKSFCSFKIKTKTSDFCRNEYNVTGTCNRHSCPLANSQYATIKEKDGIIYLYIKAAERTPYPSKQWERIKLKRNEQQAIEQINKHLIYWDRWIRMRVKKRFNRVREYLKRMRKLALGRQKKLEPIKKKIERRELHREEKALRVARLSKTVENELLERIRAGASSEKEIYNVDQRAFEKALETAELSEDEEYEQNADEDDDEEIVYTDGSDLDEEEEEIEDFVPMEESEESESELVLASTSKGKRRKVLITPHKDS